MKCLTRDQVRLIDRLAIERYGMSGLVLMENAGRNAASVIDDTYGPHGSAFICCGTGNNGGDGCVIGRHLHNSGWTVRLVMTGDESKMSADTLANFRIVRAMGLDITIASDRTKQQTLAEKVTDDDIIVDALLGTGFHGEVRSPVAEFITDLTFGSRRAVVAVDVPSGLNCDTGVASQATIRADLTVTFVAMKAGFMAPGAKSYLGRIEVADIGAPRDLIEQV